MNETIEILRLKLLDLLDNVTAVDSELKQAHLWSANADGGSVEHEVACLNDAAIIAIGLADDVRDLAAQIVTVKNRVEEAAKQ